MAYIQVVTQITCTAWIKITIYESALLQQFSVFRCDWPSTIDFHR